MVTFSNQNLKLVYVQNLASWFFQDEGEVWHRLTDPEHKNGSWESEILRVANPEEIRQIAEVREAQVELRKLDSWNSEDPQHMMWLRRIFPVGEVEAQLRAIRKD